MYAHRLVFKTFDRRLRPERYNQKLEVKRWYADGGDNAFRYDYPRLNKHSVVVDAGGYAGEWSAAIHEKYRCRVYIFEPVAKYYQKIAKRFAGAAGVKIFLAGLAGGTRDEIISIEDVGSSIFKSSANQEKIQLLDVKQFFVNEGLKRIDLLKINIEGGEYELLERLISTGLIEKVKCIQVQFHDIFPGAEKRMESIQRKLSKTHRPTYQYWFVWENWERK